MNAQRLSIPAAPTGTPCGNNPEIRADVARTLRSLELRDRMRVPGIKPIGGFREYLAANMRSDYDRCGAAIKRAGIKGERNLPVKSSESGCRHAPQPAV